MSLWNSQTFYVFGHSVSLTFARLNFSIFPYILSFLNWNTYLINANFIPMLTWFQNCLNCFDPNLLHFCWANLFMHIFGVHIIFYDVPFMHNCSLRYRRKKITTVLLYLADIGWKILNLRHFIRHRHYHHHHHHLLSLL